MLTERRCTGHVVNGTPDDDLVDCTNPATRVAHGRGNMMWYACDAHPGSALQFTPLSVFLAAVEEMVLADLAEAALRASQEEQA